MYEIIANHWGLTIGGYLALGIVVAGAFIVVYDVKKEARYDIFVGVTFFWPLAVLASIGKLLGLAIKPRKVQK